MIAAESIITGAAKDSGQNATGYNNAIVIIARVNIALNATAVNDIFACAAQSCNGVGDIGKGDSIVTTAAAYRNVIAAAGNGIVAEGATYRYARASIIDSVIVDCAVDNYVVGGVYGIDCAGIEVDIAVDIEFGDIGRTHKRNFAVVDRDDYIQAAFLSRIVAARN